MTHLACLLSFLESIWPTLSTFWSHLPTCPPVRSPYYLEDPSSCQSLMFLKTSTWLVLQSFSRIIPLATTSHHSGAILQSSLNLFFKLSIFPHLCKAFTNPSIYILWAHTLGYISRVPGCKNPSHINGCFHELKVLIKALQVHSLGFTVSDSHICCRFNNKITSV